MGGLYNLENYLVHPQFDWSCSFVFFILIHPTVSRVIIFLFYVFRPQDGVMVLSATHRYKKKYVTTLLYKPI